MKDVLIDIEGRDDFGKWTVLNYLGNGRWRCRCECGTEKSLSGVMLRSGQSNSCGCNRIVHGMSYSREYDAWSRMKKRCYLKTFPSYENYGGRGITVFHEWINDFSAFFKHIGPRPSNKHSLDRIDVNGNYEPGNVRWATWREQACNRRDTRILEFRGEKIVAKHLALRFGMNTTCMYDRLDRGMSPEEAVADRQETAVQS